MLFISIPEVYEPKLEKRIDGHFLLSPEPTFPEIHLEDEVRKFHLGESPPGRILKDLPEGDGPHVEYLPRSESDLSPAHIKVRLRGRAEVLSLCQSTARCMSGSLTPDQREEASRRRDNLRHWGDSPAAT